MEHKKHGCRLTIFIVLILVITPSIADFYKWTDKDGGVHYSDKAADENKSTEIVVATKSRAGIAHSSSDVKERNRMIRELENDRNSAQKTGGSSTQRKKIIEAMRLGKG